MKHQNGTKIQNWTRKYYTEVAHRASGGFGDDSDTGRTANGSIPVSAINCFENNI